jgi:protein-tyrosine-phosphatase
VPDPWFGGEEGFQPVYDIINEGCEKIIESILKDRN